MGFLDFVKKQFIDIIQWTEDGDGVLAWRFPMRDIEIQHGAQLTVREIADGAVRQRGQARPTSSGPGATRIKTAELPLLTYLKNWDKLFESPFKSDVYFFCTRQQPDQRWGTLEADHDPRQEFGAVRLRAFGIYSLPHRRPARLLPEGLGHARLLHRRRPRRPAAQLDPRSTHRHFAESSIPFLDMAANQVELGAAVADKIAPAVRRPRPGARDASTVQNLSLPEELQKLLDERIGMGMVGDMGKLHAVPDRAVDPGGGGQRGRRGRRRRRARRRHRDGPGHGPGDEPGRRRRPARRAGRPRRAGEPRGTGRSRARNVWPLRQTRAGGRAILSRSAAPRRPSRVRAATRAWTSPAGSAPTAEPPRPEQRSAERRSTPCPSCGAPVMFTSAQSLLAVCSYCRASLIRRDLDVEQVGTMSALLEDATPLQLAAEGVWRSTHFAVVGRVQIRWEQGMWNEWYCAFDDGRGAGSGMRRANTRCRSRPPCPRPCRRGRRSSPGCASRSVG